MFLKIRIEIKTATILHFCENLQLYKLTMYKFIKVRKVSGQSTCEAAPLKCLTVVISGVKKV